MYAASICGEGSSLHIGLLSLLIVSGLVVLNSIPTNLDAQSDQLGITKERHEYSSSHSKDNTGMKKLEQPKQTIIKLEDNAAGHAAGWDPPLQIAQIKPPFKIEQGMSFEFTSIDPMVPPDVNGLAQNCLLVSADSVNNQLGILCDPINRGSPSEGAVLTYIMSK
jgi:hypothetical protein